jgi:hypothetical protein
MPRAIVVEGPDGSGKSTLLHNLERDLRRQVIHTGGPPQTKAEEIERLARDRDLSHRRILFDRIFHISEQIYGPLYNRRPVGLTRELLELNPVIVFCCLPSMTEMLGYIDRGPKDHKSSTHMNLVLEHYPSILRSYKELMINLVCKGATVIPYSWRDHSYPNLVQELKRCAD